MNQPQFDDRQLRELVQRAEQALAAGHTEETKQLLARALAAAPNHPLVLNAAAGHQLRLGNLAGARELIELAIAGDPKNPVFWINLAMLHARAGSPKDELAALEGALAIEPRYLVALLRKAEVMERQGHRRGAAMVYRHALETVRPGTQLPQSMRASMERAARAVAANDAELESYLAERLQDVYSQHHSIDTSRFEHCIDALLGKRRIYTPAPTFLHFPKLPCLEFYPREEFPWLNELENATAEITEEFERVLVQDADRLEPYVAYRAGIPLDQWAELNHSRRWSVFYLWREGAAIQEHLDRCPRTAQLVSKAPLVDIAGHGPTAFFSILDAKSHIPAHTGVTNTRLTVHLPLIIPENCRFRVGSETRAWRVGHGWVFDDTIEHEAWNDSGVPRAILILDIWNPYLSSPERDLVRRAIESVRSFYSGPAPVADPLNATAATAADPE